MSSTDIIFYGGVAIAVIVVLALGYRFFKKRNGDAPKNHVMNKIKDFYSMQDSQNKPDINY